jgi:hypothetical protein
MEIWNYASLKDIENSLRKFILANDSYKNSKTRSVTRILVYIDVSLGLYETMDIEVVSSKHIQLLDCENFPF